MSFSFRLSLPLLLLLTAYVSGKSFFTSSEVRRTPAGAPVEANLVYDLGYFNTLDFERADIAAKIPAFEAKLVELIPQIRQRPPKEAALALASVAMYMANTWNGVNAGKIDPKTLYESDFARRNDLMLSLLEEARMLAPEHRLIRTWLEGEKIRIARGKNLKDLIHLEDADPTFNLFASLIVAREYSPTEQEEKDIFAEVRRTTRLPNPCLNPKKAKTPQCGVSPRTPFGRQGSSVLLGDAYLKQGAAAFKSGDKRRGNYYVRMAIMLYTTLYLGKANRDLTHEWSLDSLVRERHELAKSVLKNPKLADIGGYLKTPNGARPYQCASCHSRY